MADPLDYRTPRDERNAAHDVFAEPHLAAARGGERDAHLTAVWDEPVFSAEIGGDVPDGAGTFARWLDEHRIGTARSWLIALLIALAAGPFAIFGTLLDATTRFSFVGVGIIAVVFVAPVVEELMKSALALWVAERKPFWFHSSWQIVLCGLASGLGFAAVENVLYLYIYIPDASPELWRWRWTVCVALHVTCSGIASVGVARVWRSVMRHRKPARVSLAAFWLTTAAIVHGLYNAFAVWLEAVGGAF